MSKLPALAAAVLAGAAFSAQAATGTLFDLDSVLSTSGVYGPINFQAQVKKDGVVTADSVSFDLTQAAEVTLNVVKNGNSDKTGTFTLSLGSTVFTPLVIGSDAGTYSQNWTLNAANDYLLSFTPSSLASKATINYKLSFVANTLVTTPVPPTPAVPEPESYALAAAGLGVVLMLSRRRKQA